MKNYPKIVLVLLAVMAFSSCEKENFEPNYLPTTEETIAREEILSVEEDINAEGRYVAEKRSPLLKKEN